MKISKLWKVSSVCIVVLLGMTVGAASFAAVSKIVSQERIASNTRFPKNTSGQTYGSAKDLSPYEKDPDLIKAVGINGKIGYIHKSDIDGKMPKNPQEALAMQSKKEPRKINVYESDGKTVIDQFIIKPSVEKEERN